MGNRYAGTAHQHSTLADRVGSARHSRLPTRSASAKAWFWTWASGTVHRERRDGARNVATV